MTSSFSAQVCLPPGRHSSACSSESHPPPRGNVGRPLTSVAASIASPRLAWPSPLSSRLGSFLEFPVLSASIQRPEDQRHQCAKRNADDCESANEVSD